MIFFIFGIKSAQKGYYLSADQQASGREIKPLGIW
jgi:hypothetical protein